jgi:hypothetical protein
MNGPGDRRAEQVRKHAERIAVLIVSTDYPLVDIAIERCNLREQVETWFPDRLDAYDRIYESRFDRLIEQWREPEQA